MSYVWKPDPPLPWCATCGMHRVGEREQYTCPLCPPQRPCRTSLGVPAWQPRDETLARLHNRNAA